MPPPAAFIASRVFTPYFSTAPRDITNSPSVSIAGILSTPFSPLTYPGLKEPPPNIPNNFLKFANPPPLNAGIFGCLSSPCPTKFSIPSLRAIVVPTVVATDNPVATNLPPLPPRNFAAPFAPTI